MKETARQVLPQHKAPDQAVVRRFVRGRKLPLFRVIGAEDFDVDLGQPYRRRTRHYKEATCSCGEPERRRLHGLLVVAGTCAHIGLVLAALEQESVTTAEARKVEKEFRAGGMPDDEYVSILQQMKANNNAYAELLLSFHKERNDGWISPSSTEPKLAQGEKR